MIRLLILAGFIVATNADCFHPVRLTSGVVEAGQKTVFFTCDQLEGQFNKPASPAGQYLAAVKSHSSALSVKECTATAAIQGNDVNNAEFILLGAQQKCEEVGGRFL